MSEPTPVTTSVGMADGNIVIIYNQPVDTIQYPLEAAEEVATKILELIEQAREGLTNS